MLAEIRGRSQITIPAELIKKLGISEGDKFDISDYVVVDDDDFDISDNLKDNFVHVDNYTGLTEGDYSKIKFILNIQ